jgi:acetyltransferase-like isoleucine patch superfamily enzyme
LITYFGIIIRRLRALRHIELRDNVSGFAFAKTVDIIAKKGSKITLNGGSVRIGYPFPKQPPFASYPNSVISLGKNSKILFNGPVTIAAGATIRVRDEATLIFEGNNHIAHGLLIICAQNIIIGEDTAISWNVTLIDDDGHYFEDSKGRRIKGFQRPLIIKKNVGIQMNTMIPRGVCIGENSIISCGTVVRQDIPPNSLAYQEANLRIREGISAPKRKVD